MVVNSINFWIFIICVIFAYYVLFRKSSRWQNITLLAASYIFYGIVDWKMCALLLISTVVFYVLGIFIDKYNRKNSKIASSLTTLGVCLGVGILLYFKYLNFFLEQFSALLGFFGLNTNWNTFNIIMPLGISFFTFKLIGYVIEVHRGNMSSTKDPIAFGTFIAFFPTIMSGPIDNPTKFIPQLAKARKVDYDTLAEAGKRILWGMFLKMCIADQLSGYTSAVLGNYSHHNATSIIIASVLYSFQLYADFAGYTDMAVGVSQILGISISENFKRPYLSQNIAEFWRRWHISLTTWITNYVYMPLNIKFRNLGMTGIYLATILNTIIIGAWHGANWTFVLFGLYHGILISLVTFLDKPRKKFEKKHNLKNNIFYKYSRIFLTFILWTVSLLMFQANTVHDFFGTLGALGNGFGMPFYQGIDKLLPSVLCMIILLFKEYKDENRLNVHFLHSNNSIIQAISAAIIVSAILFTGALNGSSFIYFQF